MPEGALLMQIGTRAELWSRDAERRIVAEHVAARDLSPDGSRVLATTIEIDPAGRFHYRRLLEIDARTGETSSLVAQGGDTPITSALREAGMGEASQLVGPVWSSSGRHLAALANLERSDFAYVPVIFRPEGEVVAIGRPSTEFPEAFGWSPASERLAYTMGEAPYRITRADLLAPTGDDRELFSAAGQSFPIITDLAWSPTGRWVALILWSSDQRQEVRILDTADVQEPRIIEFFASDVGDPLVDWGPRPG